MKERSSNIHSMNTFKEKITKKIRENYLTFLSWNLNHFWYIGGELQQFQTWYRKVLNFPLIESYLTIFSQVTCKMSSSFLATHNSLTHFFSSKHGIVIIFVEDDDAFENKDSKIKLSNHPQLQYLRELYCIICIYSNYKPVFWSKISLRTTYW